MKKRNTWLRCCLIILVSSVWLTCADASSDPEIIEAAKKEGELVWWNTLRQTHGKKIIDIFTKKYPFIKATSWRAGGMSLHTKLMMEGRAGRFSWDVVSQTSAEFVSELKEKQFIAPYASPERKSYSDDVKDAEGYWTGFYALPFGLGYNTELVKVEEVPKTYEELVDPRWKGRKISIDTQGHEMMIGLIRAWGEKKAVKYFRSLAAQDPVPDRGNTKRILLTAAGQTPLVVAYTHTIEWNKSQGAPVDWLNLEPVVMKVDAIMLGAKAANPNAAKLFIDFILSIEGQKLFQSFRRVTLRQGVEPKPSRLIQGFRRVVLRPDESLNVTENFKRYREIFGLQ